jgi:hypothetical protein
MRWRNHHGGVGVMEKWENLLKIFEKFEAESEFVAECVWSCLTEHSDNEFENELLHFLGGEWL